MFRGLQATGIADREKLSSEEGIISPLRMSDVTWTDRELLDSLRPDININIYIYIEYIYIYRCVDKPIQCGRGKQLVVHDRDGWLKVQYSSGSTNDCLDILICSTLEEITACPRQSWSSFSGASRDATRQHMSGCMISMPVWVGWCFSLQVQYWRSGSNNPALACE